MINSNPGDDQDAPTRNSNLQCLPKNDKLNKVMQNSQGYSNSYSHKSTTQPQAQKPPKKEELEGKNNNISIEQLKELMKNP